MQSTLIAQVNLNDPLHLKVLAVTLVVAIIIIALRWKTITQRAKERRPFSPPTHPVIDAPPSVAVMPQNSPIDSVRTLMGPAPRAFAPSLSSYLRVEPPCHLLADKNDEDWHSIRSQEKLRREGMVVRATIVQANNNLFQRNSNETGASVIYSPDPWFDHNREVLRAIAKQCFALKGTDPADPESAAFARMLTNELTRALGMKVPRVFTGGREVYHSSMLMPRKHLPSGILTGVYFPVWIDPDKTGAVIIVPAAYWPPSLTKEWDSNTGN